MGRRLALKFFGYLFILPGLVILFRLWPFIPLIYCNLSFAVNESSIKRLRLFYIVKYCRVFIIECIIRNKWYERNRVVVLCSELLPFEYGTYNYFPLNIHIELSPPLSSNIHTDRTFIGRNMTQCVAHVCIVMIRMSKRSVLKRMCVQDCICRLILILFFTT
jgi:hypothetical protein